jgi:hypothetical protein
VVLGKHKGTFDTADFPFSIIEAAPDGRSTMIPGLNLATVGTVRDAAKWPARDRRRGVRRDRIDFDVLSPLTVGRMLRGLDRLGALQQQTDRSADTVNLGGTQVKRVLLRSGQKFYRTGIEMYLLGKVVARVERALEEGCRSLTDAVAAAPDAIYSADWVDLGGQLMPRGRLDALAAKIEQGALADLDAVTAELDAIHAAYGEDEWLWVKKTFPRVFDADLDRPGRDALSDIAARLLEVESRFVGRVLADAGKEFDGLSHTGFGQDGGAEDAASDFVAVRGDYDGNRFVGDMRARIERLGERVERFRQALSRL